MDKLCWENRYNIFFMKLLPTADTVISFHNNAPFKCLLKIQLKKQEQTEEFYEDLTSVNNQDYWDVEFIFETWTLDQYQSTHKSLVLGASPLFAWLFENMTPMLETGTLSQHTCIFNNLPISPENVSLFVETAFLVCLMKNYWKSLRIGTKLSTIRNEGWFPRFHTSRPWGCY